MDPDFYSSHGRYDEYQNIESSLPFSGVPTSDFYFDEEMFSMPNIFGDRPYNSHQAFASLAHGYDQPHIASPGVESSENDIVEDTQHLLYQSPMVPSQGLVEHHEALNVQQPGDSKSRHIMQRNDTDQLRKRSKSHDKRPRAPSTSNPPGTPNANVFQLDLRIPSMSQTDTQPVASQESLSSVFEVNVNSTSRRKTRSAFTPQGKKKVEAVRNVGACIQCKFRKRTCGTSKPCHLCIRRTGDPETAALLCTRESPFLDLSVIEFYSAIRPHRIVDFNFNFPVINNQRRAMKLDGRGPTSWPLRVQVVDVSVSSLDPSLRKQVQRILKIGTSSTNDSSPRQPATVTFLDPQCISSAIVEKWVMEYTYRFNKLHNDNSTSFLFGVAYAQQKLPHGNLVANMVKVIALNYILYNGFRILPMSMNQSSATFSEYPIVRAQIDTKLFQLLYEAERFVYRELQRLVFKTSGQLAKNAIVPVALVLWLLARLQSLRAGYLVNLSENNDVGTADKTNTAPGVSSGESSPYASHQKHVLNLLISVFTALFRSTFPLLMNFEDKFSRELLGGDDDLLHLAKELRVDLLSFKKRGYIRAWKCNKGCLKDEVDRLRDTMLE